jgi:hypothetical protein
MKWYSIFAHFTTTLKLGMKQGFKGQTNVQSWDDFINNSIE